MQEEKYNKKRKNILRMLDKGLDVPIIELGMYDLTPYFDEQQENLSLSEMIMVINNHERKISHVDKELFLSPPQYDALQYLVENDRVILSAPTSFGKTLLLKEYIYLHKPRNIVYIVPTKALAYELERNLKENIHFSEYTIFDKYTPVEKMGATESDEEKLFFIGTQEKYLEINNDNMRIIDLFVIDEAYKLQESVGRQRAYKLSEAFLDSMDKQSNKIVLLTPRAKLIGFEKYGFQEFLSDFNAVEKNYIVLDKARFFNELLSKENEKTILFCNSPQQINSAFMTIENSLVKKYETEFVKMLENEIHPEWCVVKLLKAGILTHHGQMPKYVQNRMINLFNESNEYSILFGTNSISEGINTVTKNLFIHPDNNTRDTLLLKNTIGRAGRLGKYPIGYIYSTENIEDVVENEIVISLAISDEEELSEIIDSKDTSKITELSEKYCLDFEFCQDIIARYKLSLSRLDRILESLRIDRKFKNITNLPYIAKYAFQSNYQGNLEVDKIVIAGYLQTYYMKDNNRVFLNNFNDRIEYFKMKSKLTMDNTEIINSYMQFIYSTLEYYIIPILNIGMDIKVKYPSWTFGENVYESIEECRTKYYNKTYGELNVDNLSEEHMRIVSALKDYGMLTILKKMNAEILDEINEKLGRRYSTIDIIRAINQLAQTSNEHREIFQKMKRKYLI